MFGQLLLFLSGSVAGPWPVGGCLGDYNPFSRKRVPSFMRRGIFQ
jgi:hypothetical protein